MRVYQKYIKGKNYVATSFVPKGKTGSGAGRLEKSRGRGRENSPGRGRQQSIRPSRRLRKNAFELLTGASNRPTAPRPKLKFRRFGKTSLSNGMRVYGIENTEVPLVQFEIVIDGGQLLEDINKVGVANLMARMMTQGTQKKTPQELEEAIQQLGASINVSAGTRGNTESGSIRWRKITMRRWLWSKRYCSSRAGMRKNSICSNKARSARSASRRPIRTPSRKIITTC